MTAPNSDSRPALAENGDDVPILAVATVLLRRWRPIVILGLAGGILGLMLGLTSRRVFESSATFIPQGSEGSVSGLAAAASQLGIRMPTGGGGGSTWGPPVYVELLRSAVLLEPIALDSVVVAEEGKRTVAVMDLLDVKAPTPAQRLDATIRQLGKIVTPGEVRTLGAVRLSVATPWPSVSLSLAQRMLDGVNRFNLNARKSAAAAERQFVEVQSREADSTLRDAEQRYREFLQSNRVIMGSPQLELERDRLQRDVSLRQQVYLSLLQSREEARIREVRDTPIITVLEYPRLAIVGEPRGSAQKAVLGGVAGGILGVILAFFIEWLARARQAPDLATREFFEQMRSSIPRFLRRGAR